MIIISSYFSTSRCSYIENSVRSGPGIHYGPQHKTLTCTYVVSNHIYTCRYWTLRNTFTHRSNTCVVGVIGASLSEPHIDE